MGYQMLICHRCYFANCSHYRERLKNERWESCEHQSTTLLPSAKSRECLPQGELETSFSRAWSSCAIEPQGLSAASLGSQGLQPAGPACKAGLQLPLHWDQGDWAGEEKQVEYLRCLEKEFWHFYSGSRIILKRSGNVGRKHSHTEQRWFVPELRFAFMGCFQARLVKGGET